MQSAHHFDLTETLNAKTLCRQLFAVKCGIRLADASNGTMHTLKLWVYLGCRLSSHHKDYERGKDEGLGKSKSVKSQGYKVGW